MAGSSEPAFLFLDIKMELLLHRLFIYFATAPTKSMYTVLKSYSFIVTQLFFDFALP